MTLPETTALTLSRESGVLHITLNRPEARNAMSLAMVNELMDVFDWLENNAGGAEVRALVLRGADGHFCAGGDIKDMAGARQQAAEGDPEAFLRLNRRFGEMISTANRLPQVLITVLEGAVMGGGFGLACVSDVAIAAGDAKFGLPETGLGVIPAQIAPFHGSGILHTDPGRTFPNPALSIDNEGWSRTVRRCCALCHYPIL